MERILCEYSFPEMNLPNLTNLPNFAKMFTFYTKYFKLSPKCSQYRFKTLQNKIKNANLPNLAGKQANQANFPKLSAQLEFQMLWLCCIL